MTVLKRTLACEYSSFYVAGSRDVEVPIGGELRRIRSSAECINVSCLIFQAGDVTVSLSDEEEAPNLTEPVFDGMLATPKGVVLLFDANMPEILCLKLADVRPESGSGQITRPSLMKYNCDWIVVGLMAQNETPCHSFKSR